MIGPPPDPTQVAVAHALVDLPTAWFLCLVIGLGVSALSLLKVLPPGLRALSFCIGQVIFWTAPLAGHLGPDLYGAFPTIDKSGSIAFYLDGVHRRIFLDPLSAIQDPAAQLIGVHVGHLWLVQLFDVFLSTPAAFNAQALLYPALGWWSAALLCRVQGASWSTGVALGFGFGMGLHVFTDLNWYTVEKAAVFVLALYAASLAHLFRGGAWWLSILAWLGCALVNWYFALVAAFGAALLLAITRSPRLAKACAGTIAIGLPLAWLQFQLLSGEAHPGSPEAYLQQRAALDVLSIPELSWNRLPLWRALDPIFVAAAAWGSWRCWHDPATRVLLLVAGILLLLALGPYPFGLPNPIWLGMRAVVPGFWRVSEPEVFFQGTLLCGIAVAARALGPSHRPALYPLAVAIWVISVRNHPHFPGFSEFRAPQLAAPWVQDATPPKEQGRVAPSFNDQEQKP